MFQIILTFLENEKASKQFLLKVEMDWVANY
jgi:hypothetical protein